MLNSRSISDLRPEVAAKAAAFLVKCKAAGMDVRITSTLRDYDYQTHLYAQGRTRAGKKVTNARAGYSWHNFGVAFDFCVFTNGKPDWNNTKAFTQAGVIGESLGLEWAGRWKSFPELAHLQFTNGLNMAQLRAQHDRNI